MKSATQAKQAAPTDAQVVPLERMYLAILCNVIAADHLDVVQQEWTEGGRLWLCHTGTTKPIANLVYKFERDSVSLGVETRDERKLVRVVHYRDGLDAFAVELQKFLRQNRLAAPKAA